jgi:protein-disulfide isomerase
VIKTIGTAIALNDNKLQQCLSSGLAESDVVRVEQTASLFNIQAVPTMFWNNKQIDALQSVEAWEGLLGL